MNAGEYRRRPFTAAPCADCHFTGDAAAHKGRVIVSLDAMQEGGGDAGAGLNEHAHTESDCIPEPTPDTAGAFAGLPPEVCERVRGFMASWLRLSDTGRAVVAARIVTPDAPLRETAARLGISTQAAHAALVHARTVCLEIAGAVFTKARLDPYGKHRAEGIPRAKRPEKAPQSDPQKHQ